MNKAEEFKNSIINNNFEFKKVFEYGIENGFIRNFGNEEWDKIKSLGNIVVPADFYQTFVDGLNVGNCGSFAKIMSYAYDNVYLVSGKLPILKNTPGSPEGKHGWFETSEYLYDTTLLIKVKKEYSSRLGYIEEYKYGPIELSNDSIYGLDVKNKINTELESKSKYRNQDC